MAPICFQFWGANAGRYYEYSGFSGMRRLWMDAIEASHPEWVEIITWNDFIEGTYVSPLDDPARYDRANDLDKGAAPRSTRNFYHTHDGATGLLAFFIQWYKTGVEPAISRDSVYWAYRTQLARESQNKAGKINIFGPVDDVVYLTANLTAPAVLRVSFGATSRSVTLPAGSTDVNVPITVGYAPRLELMRGALRLAHASGKDIISTRGTYPDFYYSTGSMHD
jgi:glucan endo-1,3-alpha-glucosidase